MFIRFTLIATSLLTSSSALATIDSVQKIITPYVLLSDLDDSANRSVRLKASLFDSELGDPFANTLEALFQPQFHLTVSSMTHGRISGALTPANVGAIARAYHDSNLLSSRSIRTEVNPDAAAYDHGTLYQEVSVDLSHTTTQAGPSKEARQEVRDLAKLIVISLMESLRVDSPATLAKIKISFTGLPRQNDLKGSILPATTQSPYTRGSPLLEKFKRELLRENCPKI